VVPKWRIGAELRQGVLDEIKRRKVERFGRMRANEEKGDGCVVEENGRIEELEVGLVVKLLWGDWMNGWRARIILGVE
jgi:hypothetical protein